MKTPYYKIKIVANHFSITLHKSYIEYTSKFAEHLNFSLQLYKLNISLVSEDKGIIKGTFDNYFRCLDIAVEEQFRYYFSNKKV